MWRSSYARPAALMMAAERRPGIVPQHHKYAPPSLSDAQPIHPTSGLRSIPTRETIRPAERFFVGGGF